MPWCTLPPEKSAHIKQALADKIKISGIPTLVALDSKGNFITDTARNEVMAANGDEEKSKALIEKWKATEAVPIEEAQLSGTGPGGMLSKVFMYFMRNPMYIVGMIFMAKKLYHRYELGGEEEEL
jgi:hypothetical protein